MQRRSACGKAQACRGGCAGCPAARARIAPRDASARGGHARKRTDRGAEHGHRIHAKQEQAGRAAPHGAFGRSCAGRAYQTSGAQPRAGAPRPPWRRTTSAARWMQAPCCSPRRSTRNRISGCCAWCFDPADGAVRVFRRRLYAAQDGGWAAAHGAMGLVACAHGCLCHPRQRAVRPGILHPRA